MSERKDKLRDDLLAAMARGIELLLYAVHDIDNALSTATGGDVLSEMARTEGRLRALRETLQRER